MDAGGVVNVMPTIGSILNVCSNNLLQLNIFKSVIKHILGVYSDNP